VLVGVGAAVGAEAQLLTHGGNRLVGAVDDPGQGPVGQLDVLLVVEQQADGPADVLPRARQPVLGVGARGVDHGVPVRALADQRLHLDPASLLVGGGPVEAVGQPVDGAVEVDLDGVLEVLALQ
jgi:hypothetical protein